MKHSTQAGAFLNVIDKKDPPRFTDRNASATGNTSGLEIGRTSDRRQSLGQD